MIDYSCMIYCACAYTLKKTISMRKYFAGWEKFCIFAAGMLRACYNTLY